MNSNPIQPIVDLQSGHIVGYESLLRWHHPTRGVLAPGEFLKVAEDTGIIEQIDWQMLSLTCQAIPALAQGDRYVTLNVSPRRFHAPDLAQRLLAQLDRNQVDHHSIRIEITEDAMLENPDQVLATRSRSIVRLCATSNQRLPVEVLPWCAQYWRWPHH